MTTITFSKGTGFHLFFLHRLMAAPAVKVKSFVEVGGLFYCLLRGMALGAFCLPFPGFPLVHFLLKVMVAIPTGDIVVPGMFNMAEFYRPFPISFISLVSYNNIVKIYGIDWG